MDCQNSMVDLRSSNWTCKIGGSQDPSTTTRTGPGQNPSYFNSPCCGLNVCDPPPNSYVAALTPRVMVFGGGAFVR